DSCVLSLVIVKPPLRTWRVSSIVACEMMSGDDSGPALTGPVAPDTMSTSQPALIDKNSHGDTLRRALGASTVIALTALGSWNTLLDSSRSATWARAARSPDSRHTIAHSSASRR